MAVPRRFVANFPLFVKNAFAKICWDMFSLHQFTTQSNPNKTLKGC